MGAPFGVLATGFNAKTLEEIKKDEEDFQKAGIHPLWDVSSASPMGQIIGIVASDQRELWELVQIAYESNDPDAAIEAAMVQLSLLTGTARLGETQSLVPCTVNLDAGTFAVGVLVGSVAGNPDARFSNRDEIVSAGGDETGEIFIADNTGPVAAPNGELNVIAEAFLGFNSIINTDDATLGNDIETIVALRFRREDELEASGSTNVDAIRDNVDKVTGVITATVLENITEITDALGVPAKSFEVIVWDGDPTAAIDNEIAQAIWNGKPTGIRSHGDAAESGVAVGTDKATHTIPFTRVTPKDIFLEFDLVGSPDIAALKLELVAFGDLNYAPGDDVILSKLNAIAVNFADVTDRTETRAGLAPAPAGTVNVVMGTRENAVLKVANILINGS